MRNSSHRILALAVFGAFGVAIGGGFFALQPSSRSALPPPPALLPSAHANPAEVGVEDTLRTGETLSQLLLRAQLAEEEAKVLVGELGNHQDPRRLRPGSVVSYRKSFSDGTVRGMELKLDADRTLNLHRRGEEWSGTVEEVPVHSDTVVLAGVVRTSLYAALLHGEGEGVPSAERERVADVLADRIFAWQIDFSRDLRPGDEFRVLYERLVRPDGTARAGRVLGVQFRINDREHEAYLFRAADGSEDYYQRNGESLKRAFLRAPLEFRRISSSFALSRFHPILKINRPHNGIDYAAAAGTPVRAVGDAVVVKAERTAGYGNLLELRHSRGYTTRYAHLRYFAKGIRSGSRVKQGDLIGYVGMTGLATAPHLHYEFRMNGKPVNPNTVKFITGEPVPSRYRAQFRRQVSAQIAALDRGSSPVLLADADRGREKVSLE